MKHRAAIEIEKVARGFLTRKRLLELSEQDIDRDFKTPQKKKEPTSQMMVINPPKNKGSESDTENEGSEDDSPRTPKANRGKKQSIDSPTNPDSPNSPGSPSSAGSPSSPDSPISPKSDSSNSDSA